MGKTTSPLTSIENIPNKPGNSFISYKPFFIDSDVLPLFLIASAIKYTASYEVAAYPSGFTLNLFS